jgi:hypothetical protein
MLRKKETESTQSESNVMMEEPKPADLLILLQQQLQQSPKTKAKLL